MTTEEEEALSEQMILELKKIIHRYAGKGLDFTEIKVNLEDAVTSAKSEIRLCKVCACIRCKEMLRGIYDRK